MGWENDPQYICRCPFLSFTILMSNIYPNVHIMSLFESTHVVSQNTYHPWAWSACSPASWGLSSSSSAGPLDCWYPVRCPRCDLSGLLPPKWSLAWPSRLCKGLGSAQTVTRMQEDIICCLHIKQYHSRCITVEPAYCHTSWFLTITGIWY